MHKFDQLTQIIFCEFCKALQTVSFSYTIYSAATVKSITKALLMLHKFATLFMRFCEVYSSSRISDHKSKQRSFAYEDVKCTINEAHCKALASCSQCILSWYRCLYCKHQAGAGAPYAYELANFAKNWNLIIWQNTDYFSAAHYSVPQKALVYDHADPEIHVLYYTTSGET